MNHPTAHETIDKLLYSRKLSPLECAVLAIDRIPPFYMDGEAKAAAIESQAKRYAVRLEVREALLCCENLGGSDHPSDLRVIMKALYDALKKLEEL